MGMAYEDGRMGGYKQSHRRAAWRLVAVKRCCYSLLFLLAASALWKNKSNSSVCCHQFAWMSETIYQIGFGEFWQRIIEHLSAFGVVMRESCVSCMREWAFVHVCCTEEARCVRSGTTTSPNVTAFVQGPNGQYFVPGECLMLENEWQVVVISQMCVCSHQHLLLHPLFFVCCSGVFTSAAGCEIILVFLLKKLWMYCRNILGSGLTRHIVA